MAPPATPSFVGPIKRVISCNRCIIEPDNGDPLLAHNPAVKGATCTHAYLQIEIIIQRSTKVDL
jgi:hypothetical protein